MTRWKKRVTAVLLSLCLAASLTVPALAEAETPPTEGDTAPAQAGGVTLIPPKSFAEDLAGAVVDVDVYKVADLDLETGLFTLVGEFTDLASDWDGILGPEDADVKVTELWDAASKLVNARTMDPEATPAPTAEPNEDPEATPEPTQEPVSPIEPDFTAEGVALDGNGRIEIMQQLGAGLYLIVPRSTETHDWVYSFGSGLLSVPSVIRESNSWNYELTAELKAEREHRLTGIEIQKTLTTYNETLGAVTFVFEVTAELDGEVVYNNVVSMEFTGPGTRALTVQGIPVGAHVTVKEVYTGASYEVVGEDGDTVEIPALDLPDELGGMERVAFTNDYDGGRVPDPSAVNVFTFNGTGWEWHRADTGEAEG